MRNAEITEIVKAAGMIQSWHGAAATREIENNFEILGGIFGYKVAFRWLYDIIWCKEESQFPDIKETTDKVLTLVPMVLECELNKWHPDVDGDFQKLLLARAEVRVWITSCKDAKRHIDLCKNQISRFPGTSGDHYVFAVYDQKDGKPIIEHYVAP